MQRQILAQKPNIDSQKKVNQEVKSQNKTSWEILCSYFRGLCCICVEPETD